MIWNLCRITLRIEELLSICRGLDVDDWDVNDMILRTKFGLRV